MFTLDELKMIHFSVIDRMEILSHRFALTENRWEENKKLLSDKMDKLILLEDKIVNIINSKNRFLSKGENI